MLCYGQPRYIFTYSKPRNLKKLHNLLSRPHITPKVTVSLRVCVSILNPHSSEEGECGQKRSTVILIERLCLVLKLK